jgi:hypothetical protein
MKYLLALFIVMTLQNCSNSDKILKHHYKDSWPFIVTSGELECNNGNEIVFIYNSDKYALNRAAIKSRKYLSIESMRKRNPPPRSGKISLSAILKTGKALCSKK